MPIFLACGITLLLWIERAWCGPTIPTNQLIKRWATNQPTTGTEPPTHQPATCPASFANFSLQRSSNIWANALLGAPSGWFSATVVGGWLVVGWRLFLLLALVVLLLAVNAVLCCRWVPGPVTGPTIVNSEPPRLPFQMLHCFCVPVWLFHFWQRSRWFIYNLRSGEWDDFAYPVPSGRWANGE